MGGNVFTVAGPDGQPPLKVPRMSSTQYKHMRDTCVAKLQTVYEYVAVPHEAPGKTSHGDVDIHVARPTRPITKRDLGELLGARRMHLTGTITSSYAVLLPADLDAAVVVEGDGEAEEDEEEEYCQVDVHHAAEGYEAWEMMLQSYGDLMQIVGKFLRYAGFTATDKGLHVRVPEIEQAGRRSESMLYLCHDAERFMRFLGLDRRKWRAGFEHQEELFAWCCGGRFFAAQAFEMGVENHNDRQRYRKRTMFGEFANEWLPWHEGVCPYAGDREVVRKAALQEAIASFGKEAEYERKLREWRQGEDEKAFWERMSENIPRTGDKLRLTRRALKRWVDFSDAGPVLREEAELEFEKQPLWTARIAEAGDGGLGIYKWIAEHWETPYRLEKQREAVEREKREGQKRARTA